MSKNPESLFDNLITFEQLRRDVLKDQFAKNTIYNWVSQGMPKVKIKRKLFFRAHEVITWLERTSLSHGNS